MAGNPYLTRKNKSTIGRAGIQSEKRLSKSLGGRLKPASGALDGAKGDITVGDTLMEAKSTQKASISIKHDWLLKIAGEALREGKTPALAVSFTDERGIAHRSGEWVMIPKGEWERLKP